MSWRKFDYLEICELYLKTEGTLRDAKGEGDVWVDVQEDTDFIGVCFRFHNGMLNEYESSATAYLSWKQVEELSAFLNYLVEHGTSGGERKT